MKKTKALVLVFCCSLAHSLCAQSVILAELPSIRSGPAPDTNASFAAGMTRDGGASYVTQATTTDSIEINGVVRPDAGQTGQSADLYLVVKLGKNWFMRNTAGQYVLWNQRVPSLVPYREGVTLGAENSVQFFKGKLPVTGTLSLFLGYKPADGRLYYTPVPHNITLSPAPPPEPEPEPEPEETPLEQASALFEQRISPNIVQGICIACHVEGGTAQGFGVHLFARSTVSGHLDSNFGIFQNLVAVRGKAHVLTKVTGGGNHFGGQVIVNGSQTYNDLDAFLSLLEQ